MSTPPQANILVIDNDEDVVRGITKRLESVGYHCQTAHTGAQGLSEFSLADIDLVITDLNMPSLDGIGLVEKIRQFSDVPVIIVTGFKQEYAAKLNRLSDVTIVRKPFDSQQLIDLVTAEIAMRPRKAS